MDQYRGESSLEAARGRSVVEQPDKRLTTNRTAMSRKGIELTKSYSQTFHRPITPPRWRAGKRQVGEGLNSWQPREEIRTNTDQYSARHYNGTTQLLAIEIPVSCRYLELNADATGTGRHRPKQLPHPAGCVILNWHDRYGT